MAEFRTIEIDFDIHKMIEAERRSFSEREYEILRRMLGLPSRSIREEQPTDSSRKRSWSGEGVTLNHGTELRMTYNGCLHEGQIIDGDWVIDGKTFKSPSGAASGVATTKSGKKTRLDGWIYWEVKAPGETTWTHISALRRNAYVA